MSLREKLGEENLFPVLLIVCYSLALFFFLISWWVGGTEAFENLFGFYTLAFLIAGIVAGILLLKASCRPVVIEANRT